jgi:hypothetical protein
MTHDEGAGTMSPAVAAGATWTSRVEHRSATQDFGTAVHKDTIETPRDPAHELLKLDADILQPSALYEQLNGRGSDGKVVAFDVKQPATRRFKGAKTLEPSVSVSKNRATKSRASIGDGGKTRPTMLRTGADFGNAQSLSPFPPSNAVVGDRTTPQLTLVGSGLRVTNRSMQGELASEARLSARLRDTGMKGSSPVPYVREADSQNGNNASG